MKDNIGRHMGLTFYPPNLRIARYPRMFNKSTDNRSFPSNIMKTMSTESHKAFSNKTLSRDNALLTFNRQNNIMHFLWYHQPTPLRDLSASRSRGKGLGCCRLLRENWGQLKGRLGRYRVRVRLRTGGPVRLSVVSVRALAPYTEKRIPQDNIKGNMY